MEKTMMLPAMYNVLSHGRDDLHRRRRYCMTQALLAALLPALWLVQGKHGDP